MSQKSMKMFVVGGDLEYANWMGDFQYVKSVAEADVVLFTGGEDVSPMVYKRAVHPRTSCNPRRDLYEVGIIKDALERGVKIVGICRGSQFICAAVGGVLVQHQNNPSLYHEMKTYDGKTVIVTSTHHQAQYPWTLPNGEYKVLGWTEGVSAFHEDGNQKEMINQVPFTQNKECEVVWYPKHNALGIQSHPEMLWHRRETHPEIRESMLWMRLLLNKFISSTIE